MAWPPGRIVNARMRDGVRLVLHSIEEQEPLPSSEDFGLVVSLLCCQL